MTDEVKKGAEDASTQTEGSTDLTDLAQALKESLEREAAEKARADKAETERENYKTGMLKAKGKVKTEETEEEETTQKEDTSSELVGVVKQLLEQNKELATAAANRSQISTAGQGTSSESKVKVGDNLLSEAQMADLKARGWDDTKIALLKTNLQKSR